MFNLPCSNWPNTLTPTIQIVFILRSPWKRWSTSSTSWTVPYRTQPALREIQVPDAHREKGKISFLLISIFYCPPISPLFWVFFLFSSCFNWIFSVLIQGEKDIFLNQRNLWIQIWPAQGKYPREHVRIVGDTQQCNVSACAFYLCDRISIPAVCSWLIMISPHSHVRRVLLVWLDQTPLGVSRCSRFLLRKGP
jgi:hypothetical protein